MTHLLQGCELRAACVYQVDDGQVWIGESATTIRGC
jgi:hypothetical protein